MRNLALIIAAGILILFSVLASPVFAGAETKIKIRALTYNVGLLRSDVVGDVVPNVAKRAELLPQIITELVKSEGVDVVFLQELWRAEHRNPVELALKNANYIVVKPSEKTFRKYYDGSGYLLAIRDETIGLSFDQFESFAWASRIGWDAWTTKGTLVAGLYHKRDSAVRFVFLGAHLLSLTLDPETGTIINMKESNGQISQIQQIGAKIDQFGASLKRPQKAPFDSCLVPDFLIMGDFNLGPTLALKNYDALIQELEAKNVFTTLYPAALKPNPTLITWDRENPLVKDGHFPTDPSALIDHVFLLQGEERISLSPVSGKIVLKEKLKNLDYPLSDHYGLMVDFELVSKGIL